MDEIIGKIKEKYKNGEISSFDTLTINFSDWSFNLRPSANDPLIRLNIEADTSKKVIEKINNYTLEDLHYVELMLVKFNANFEQLRRS
jgi:phosphomannomutase